MALKTWTGAVDGTWDNPGNWNPSGIPLTGDDVEFPAVAPANDCEYGPSVGVAVGNFNDSQGYFSPVQIFAGILSIAGGTSVCIWVEGMVLAAGGTINIDGVVSGGVFSDGCTVGINFYNAYGFTFGAGCNVVISSANVTGGTFGDGCTINVTGGYITGGDFGAGCQLSFVGATLGSGVFQPGCQFNFDSNSMISANFGNLMMDGCDVIMGDAEYGGELTAYPPQIFSLKNTFWQVATSLFVSNCVTDGMIVVFQTPNVGNSLTQSGNTATITEFGGADGTVTAGSAPSAADITSFFDANSATAANVTATEATTSTVASDVTALAANLTSLAGIVAAAVANITTISANVAALPEQLQITVAGG